MFCLGPRNTNNVLEAQSIAQAKLQARLTLSLKQNGGLKIKILPIFLENKQMVEEFEAI